jgi:protein-S-isoprenylcysteine O-methyltransferase Ste14
MTSIASTPGQGSVVSRDTGAPRWLWRNIPIPQAHVAGIAVGVVLEFAAPWRVGLPWSVRLASSAVAAVSGLFFIIWAVRSAGPVYLAKPARLLTTGAYRRSRNPMYVGWMLAYVGVSMFVGSVWLLVLFPLVVVITHLEILAEERFLTRRLGEPYVRYRARTHRYL